MVAAAAGSAGYELAAGAEEPPAAESVGDSEVPRPSLLGRQRDAEERDALQLLRRPESEPSRPSSTIPPASALRATIGSDCLEVTSLTPLEARLRLSGAADVGALSGKVEIAFSLGGARALANVAAETHFDPASGSLVARFVHLPLTGARQIVSLLRRAGAAREAPFTREVASGQRRASAVLQALVWSGASGDLVDVRGRRARITPLQVEGGTEPCVVWRIDGGDVDAPFRVDLRGPWSVFSFKLERIRRYGSVLVSEVPSRFVRLRRRIWRRLSEPVESDVQFAHPIWPELEVRARVQDVSFGGMAVCADAEDMLLFPGLELPAIELTGGPGAGLTLPASVCHVGGRDEEGRPVCGLRVAADDGDSGWTRAVREQTYRHTQSGATPFAALWELYGDSGYLGIAGTRDARAESLAVPAATAVRSLDAAPEIAMNVVWPSGDGVVGALTVVKVYAHTWFGQHMAKRGGATADGWPGRLVLREMHLHAYEHALRDAGARWFLGYVRHDAGWPKLVHVAFPHRAAMTGEACVVPFRAFRIPSAGGARVHLAGVEVGPPTDDEIAALASTIARVRPRPYIEALDLVADRLPFAGVSAAWARTGLMRERVVLVSRRDGELAAAGIFEATSDGVHVYDLLDCARLFALAPGGASTFGALLGAAKPWFGARKRPAFVYLAEDEPPAELALLAAEDMGAADATITPRALLPDLLEHMWEVTASPPVTTM